MFYVLFKEECKEMGLTKMDKYTKYEAVSLRQWKNNQDKTIKFLDEGKNVDTVNGEQVVFCVEEGGATKNLWVKPLGSMHMGLNDFLPVEGKTLVISKEILDGDVKKGTRYNAREVPKQIDLVTEKPKKK